MAFERIVNDSNPPRHVICTGLPDNRTLGIGTLYRCTCGQLSEVRKSGFFDLFPGVKKWTPISG
jgi:hypothetical protein